MIIQGEGKIMVTKIEKTYFNTKVKILTTGETKQNFCLNRVSVFCTTLNYFLLAKKLQQNANIPILTIKKFLQNTTTPTITQFLQNTNIQILTIKKFPQHANIQILTLKKFP
jgi:hypothetical protein